MDGRVLCRWVGGEHESSPSFKNGSLPVPYTKLSVKWHSISYLDYPIGLQ